MRHRRGVTVGPRSALDPRTLLLAGAGGAVGACLRWVVVTLAADDGRFPWWTLLVNVVGCLALGALARSRAGIRWGAGVGFCGGLSTFSTFSLEVATLLDDGEAIIASSYLAASVVLGIVAFVVGRWVATS